MSTMRSGELSLWLIPLIASCSSASPARSTAPPPVFGGQGAVVSAPREMPLPVEARAPSGPCAAPSPPSDAALLDDFEDGDAAVFTGFQREGWWFAASDATDGAKLWPVQGQFRPERLPPKEAHRENLFAAHLHAEGQKDWGAVWGVSLRWRDKGLRCPLNLASYAGLRLRAKGPAIVRVAFGQPATLPPDSGGMCASGCYDLHGKMLFLSDHWDDYLVRWDRLEQGGWGTESRFDPARIVSLQFAAKAPNLPVDLWIDDLAFVTAPEADAVAAAQRSQPVDPSVPLGAPDSAKKFVPSAPSPAPGKPAPAVPAPAKAAQPS